MDLDSMYNKTLQMWNLTMQCRDELESELCHKKLRHKQSGAIGDFYDVDLTYTTPCPVRIIIMDEWGGKHRGSMTDFEVL